MRTKAGKSEDKHEQEKLMTEIANREANLPELEYLPKLYGNNFTPESLADDVFEQGGKFAILSDEGGVMETLSGLYSSGNANVDIILKGIDGGDARTRRKLFNYNINPYLTFLLVVQPQILMNMGGKKAFTGNGMLERFLYVIPKSNLGYRTHDTDSIPAHLKEQYNGIIHELLELPQGEEPIKLTLATEAKNEWKQFQKAIEHQLRSGGKLESCVGWGGKISGFALRLAGLIHVCETLGKSYVVSAQAMNKALELAALLCEHAVAAFLGMGAEQSATDAQDVLKWLEELHQPSFTKTEIVRALKNKACGKSERLDKALKILAERHIISEPVTKPTSNSFKPTTYFEINPSICGVVL
jgi:putative DNA primase/helicase